MTTPCAPSASAEGYDTLEQTLSNARSLLVVLGSRTDSIIAEMVRQLNHHIEKQTAASPDDALELAKALTELRAERSLNDELGRIVQDHCVTITALRAQIAALKAANEEMRADAERFQYFEKIMLDIADDGISIRWLGDFELCRDLRVVIDAHRAALASSAAGEGE